MARRIGEPLARCCRWDARLASEPVGLLVAKSVDACPEFTPLTDFPGAEGDAVIPRDGKFAAFVSDRDGATVHAWAGQIGTGEFQNLTKGRAPELGNPRVRNLSFSPDGSQVTMEVRNMVGRISSGPAPTMGGPVGRTSCAVVSWPGRRTGRKSPITRMHPGDPIFVTGPNERIGKQIYVAAYPGVHCH